MIREIIRDEAFLSRKAEAADKEDLSVGQDLLDTLLSHSDHCVGMAANMIGIPKAVIVFMNGDTPTVFYNPRILRASDPYETQEGCLSLEGQRNITRFETIKVEYQNAKFQKRVQTFTGYTAEIIQHEIDHLNGIII